MELTLVGVVCLLGCLLVVARPARWGVVVFGVFMPLQTAAAFNLWAAGGLSIICIHVLIGAFALSVVLRGARTKAYLKDALSRPATLFLAAFTAYAVFTAFTMPVVFGGGVDVYSLERPAEGYRITTSALRPSSGNITQSLYLTFDLILFSILAFLVSRPRGAMSAFLLLNAATAAHIFFGVLSAMPQGGPVAALFETIRTANYAIAPHHVIGGLKRLIGSYAEPSAFGAMSTGLFAYNAVRFMQTRGLWHCFASLALLFFVAASMSTTAYAVMGLLIIIWCCHTMITLVRAGLSSEHLTAVFSSALVVTFTLALFFHEPAQALAAELYEKLFRAKFDSVSGVERTAWNLRSLQNLFETNGLGVGLGSSRASSMAAVILGNVGAPGAVLYLGFLATSFLKFWPRRMPEAASDPEAVVARRTFVAARAGALAMLLSHLISGTNVDGGVQFFAFAAIAAGAYLAAPRRRALPAGLPAVWTSTAPLFARRLPVESPQTLAYWPKRELN